MGTFKKTDILLINENKEDGEAASEWAETLLSRIEESANSIEATYELEDSFTHETKTNAVAAHAQIIALTEALDEAIAFHHASPTKIVSAPLRCVKDKLKSAVAETPSQFKTIMSWFDSIEGNTQSITEEQNIEKTDND